MGKRLAKFHLARALEIHRDTLAAWLKQPGAPKPDKARRYDLASVRAFAALRAVEAKSGNTTVGGTEMGELRKERLRIQTQQAAFEFAQAKGDMMPKAEIAGTLTRLIVEIDGMLRQKFEFELPSKYKGRSQIECQQLNAQALDDIVRRFKTGGAAMQEGGR